MNTVLDLDNKTRNTRRREFADGMFDFVVAGLILFLAVANWLVFSFIGLRWLAAALLWNRELTIIGLLALIPLFYLLIVGARGLINRIRYKTIWKNSGRLEPLRWQVNWRTSLASGLTFILLIIVALILMNRGLIDSVDVLRVLVAATGAAMGVTYFGLGIEIRFPRYRWVGIAGLLLSTVLAFMPLSFASAWLGLGIIWAAVLAVSGAWGVWKTSTAAERS
jgi:hypothetical protein